MSTSWKKRTADELWLRVLSQVVVAGNAAPEYTLRTSKAVHEKLAFHRLKNLSPQRRRKIIHGVLRAIGTRYVGNSSKNRKVNAALHTLDRRLNRILECVGAKVTGSLNKRYEEIEKELIEKVATPCGLSGGELDRILFQNYDDIMVRLLCP
jgi:hypothetical protein